MKVFKGLTSFFILPFLAFFLTFCTTPKESQEKVAYSHFQIGVKLLSQGKRAQALEQLLLARDMDPLNPLILNHLGLVYFFMGNMNILL